MTSNCIRTLATLVFLAISFTPPAEQAVGQETPPNPQDPPAEPLPPSRPLLYFFEHVSLREAAFEYDQDIQALIANPRQAGQPIARLFAKAGMRAVGVPNFNADGMLDDARSFMRQIKFETIERGGYKIHLMAMPSPAFPPEAYYIAIVYKDGEELIAGRPAPSTRYITLEKTSAELGTVALGEWDADGKHTTHALSDREPAILDFVVTVYSMLGIER